MMTELDHITVAALTLEQGLAHVKAALGVDVPAGGAHPRMATHNHVLRLGPAVFLEVIAIDPAAAVPTRPRWFALDDATLQAELRIAPKLVTWVVRSSEISRTLLACDRPLGAIEPMTRGDLRWLITVPNDGSLPDGGMLPALIQWADGPHPATRMRDLGCALERLEAVHPDPWGYHRTLASISANRNIEIHAAAAGSSAHLVAHIRTPHGVRILR
ncbi:MAG: VOC family protein [Kofleriaceae bacterium]